MNISPWVHWQGAAASQLCAETTVNSYSRGLQQACAFESCLHDATYL
jgi:hypothetical protein